jgi:pilus assembly protein Flp/PilA
MSNILQSIGQFTRSFLRDEEGAQVIEYELIIAVVSIALIVLLRGLTEDPAGGFSAFIDRVTVCLTTGAACI